MWPISRHSTILQFFIVERMPHSQASPNVGGAWNLAFGAGEARWIIFKGARVMPIEANESAFKDHRHCPRHSTRGVEIWSINW